jgi:hypothetical protein
MTGEKPLYEQRVVHLLEFKRPSNSNSEESRGSSLDRMDRSLYYVACNGVLN